VSGAQAALHNARTARGERRGTRQAPVLDRSAKVHGAGAGDAASDGDNDHASGAAGGMPEIDEDGMAGVSAHIAPPQSVAIALWRRNACQL
jgi:hypothetical protein